MWGLTSRTVAPKVDSMRSITAGASAEEQDLPTARGGVSAGGAAPGPRACLGECVAAEQRKWGRTKRAGTSPVNVVVREKIMGRQVHFQSSD